MSKVLKVVVVCGAGVGTSNMMKAYIEEAFSSLDIKTSIENVGLARAKSTAGDVLITSTLFKYLAQEVSIDVIVVKNLFDKEEIKNQVETWVKSKDL